MKRGVVCWVGWMWMVAGCSESKAEDSGGSSGTGTGTGAGAVSGAESGSGMDPGTGTGTGTGTASTGVDGGFGPGPWDAGVEIPREPQPPGDPQEGYRALLEEGYVSCGIPYSLFQLGQPFLGSFADEEPLPGRTGKNGEVPLNWTVHETDDGAEIASLNCLECHMGRFDGQLMEGLGKADVDYTSDLSSTLGAIPTIDLGLPGMEEMVRWIDRGAVVAPFTRAPNIGVNPADTLAIVLAAHRDRDTLQWHDEPQLPLPEAMVPVDTPPWWRVHKKGGLFYNGMARGDHRGTMMFASSLCTDDVEEMQEILTYFDDINAYIASIRAPKYPFAIDEALAAEGEPVFEQHCAGCHGLYAEDEESEWYPNLLFPLEVIGTDPEMALAGAELPQFIAWFNESPYGGITQLVADDPFAGYVAPPLDGIWATAPYFHNASVPDLELVLDSSKRPKYWRRVDYDSRNFDEQTLGWPYLALDLDWTGEPMAFPSRSANTSTTRRESATTTGATCSAMPSTRSNAAPSSSTSRRCESRRFGGTISGMPSGLQSDEAPPDGLGDEPSIDGPDRVRTRAKVLAGLFPDVSGGAEPPPPLAGRFEFVRSLGAGAMGEVVLARDLELGREVALKRLTAHSRDDDHRRQRILREARALAKIHHPHVVTLFDAQVHEGDVLLAMEYVDGPTLDAWVQRDPPIRQIVEHLQQAALGLAAIHRAGLVHRDVKPSNILVGLDGRVRVADLGLARIETIAVQPSGSEAPDPVGDRPTSRTQPESMTRTGALVGTPAYMAPEQLAGGPADARADQFAFGVTMYEAVHGVRPFAGDTAETLAQAIRAGDRRPPKPGRRVPGWLLRVLDRTLAPLAKDRYASMDEVVEALSAGRRRRTRVVLLAAVVASAGAGGVGVLATRAPATTPAVPDPCPRDEEALDRAWSEQDESRLRDRIDAVAAADAEALAPAVISRSSAYAEAWVVEQQQACRDTHVRKLQTPQRLEQRLACLERRRADFERLIDETPSMNADEIARLPLALSRLPAPETCGVDSIASAAWARQATALVDQARSDILLDRLADAEQTLEAAREAVGDHPESDGIVAEILMGQADVARERGEFSRAKELYLEAVELAESARRDEQAAILWLDVVATDIKDRDAERTEFYLARARAAVSRLGHPAGLEASLQHKWGQQDLVAGRHAEAVKRFEDALRLYEGAQADGLNIAPIYMDLGRAHYLSGGYDAAAQEFAKVVEMYEAEYGRRHPRVASALNNLGSSLSMANRLDEATEALERALDIRRERLGPDHRRVAQTLNALASIRLIAKDLESALTLYQEALEVQRRATGPDHVENGPILANIGRTLSRLGRHDEALVQLQAAVDLASKGRDADDPDVADKLHGLASAYVAAGRAGASLEPYGRALDIRRRAYGDEAVKTAETGVAMAEALRQAKRRADAKTTIDQWLPVLEAGLGDDHPSVVQARATRDGLSGGPG